jgi:hypothetical protein
MAAIAASRNHPGHHFWQLVRDHRQNDYAHHDGRQLPYVPGIDGLLDELLQEGRAHADDQLHRHQADADADDAFPVADGPVASPATTAEAQ